MTSFMDDPLVNLEILFWTHHFSLALKKAALTSMGDAYLKKRKKYFNTIIFKRWFYNVTTILDKFLGCTVEAASCDHFRADQKW